MEFLPEALYRAADVREADRRATAMDGGSAEIPGAAFPPAEQHVLGGGQLMERAGSAGLNLLRERWPRARRIAVLCGPGNNGGDGYVVARLARAAGLEVEVFSPSGPDRRSGDARAAWQRWRDAGGAVHQNVTADWDAFDLIVDALFGTGLERPLEGVARELVESVNAARRPMLALDLPSGLHADTGRVLGVAVHADITLTFIGLKAGLFTGQGREYSGMILLDDLDVPPDIWSGLAPAAWRITPSSLRGVLGSRPRSMHKNMAGHLLVVGGKPGMPGAVRLAAEAALRAGAGLVSVATHASHAASISAARPELISYGIDDAKALTALLIHATTVALGPGLGQDEWARALWRVVVHGERPLVVDADALNLLAQMPAKRPDWILTPHPGEAARLLGATIAEVEADRFAAVRALVDGYGGVCVLKGSGTVIAGESNSPIWLCDRGNPALATAGSGDVLTGAIAALLAQGLAPIDAARLGVWAHATAGDRVAARGERGMLAGDLLPPLRDTLNGLVHESRAPR